jgi:hypothetical protein
MIDYLWKELRLYLPSIKMKASYIMEFILGEHYAFSCVIKCRVLTVKGNVDIHQKHGGDIDGEFPST